MLFPHIVYQPRITSKTANPHPARWCHRPARTLPTT